MLLANLASMAKAAITEENNEKNEGKELKYKYKANTNIVIGKMKDNLIKAILEPDAEKQSEMIDNIINNLTRCVVPIREGRTCKRNKTEVTFRYSTNKKRCL
jgi:hypothetical protein